jgi:hypothetical protein
MSISARFQNEESGCSVNLASVPKWRTLKHSASSGAAGPILERDPAYRDPNGKFRQESAKSESLMVAESLLRDRLSKVERGLPVAQMKKLKYEDKPESQLVAEDDELGAESG